MPRFEKSIYVNVPPQKAYEYLSDVTKHGEWAGHNLSGKKTSEGPIAVGATFETVGHQMGAHKGVVTIRELVPNQKIVFESNDDTAQVRHTFELTPRNGGTHITKTFETIKTGLILTIFRPSMYFVGPRMIQKDLQHIKGRLEA
jgi:uncharacterized protein YndB with AHSA1/START domain